MSEERDDITSFYWCWYSA